MSALLENITIDVGDDAGEIELHLNELVPISEDLSQEFTDQPSLYAYIAMLAARAEACWLDAKVDKERVYATTDKAVRRSLSASGDKVTEPMVKAGILGRKKYREAIEYEIQCHEQHLIMKALTKAMDQRAQMLISLGAHLRAEADQAGMLIRDTKAMMDTIKKKGKG